MTEKQNIIGMTDLLDEVSQDLEDFRRKHASDYGVKNITLWWELERERLLVRHKDVRVARHYVPGRRFWRVVAACLATFTSGVLATLLLR